MGISEQDKKQLIEKFDFFLTGGTLRIPEDIGQWLGRALLLYGMPFNYLVPDETMLPPESIRFFSLDPGWLKCLLEGACSVGRNDTIDTVLDEHLRNHFLTLAGEKAREVRADQKGLLHWPLTGFLLRSLIVEGWQGLEMKATGMDAGCNRIDPLEPLRIDRLGPEIMICIFNGKVTRIEIKQPPEGLHFGASFANTNIYQKIHLRKLYPKNEAGNQIPTTEVNDTDVPMRPGVDRVIDIQVLAATMKDKLNKVKAINGTSNGAFTSAEFGVQMVESPGKATFTSKSNEAKKAKHE
jgi:hypothetical protein